MPRNKSIRDAYDRNAGRYEQHAALENEVCIRLLDRVAFKRSEPGIVLDLGCGTGTGAAGLKKKFPKAQVIGLDFSTGMLFEAVRKSRLTRPIRFINADVTALPLAQGSVDMVFSNLAIMWLEETKTLFAEIRRVLKPGGMLLFSTLGPGSLEQLGKTISLCLEDQRLPRLPDLLEVGDALTAAGFQAPVMDVDQLTLHYPGLGAMFEEFEVTGTSLLLEKWLEVKNKLQPLESNWATVESGQRYPIGFEIIYGIAFGPPEGQPRRTENGEIATFSVDSLLKSRSMVYD
jgi:malonyl-CoA O-methyltransferase